MATDTDTTQPKSGIEAYPIIDHPFDVVVVGAGGSGLHRRRRRRRCGR